MSEPRDLDRTIPAAVLIDSRFVRDAVRDAVRQFFVPLTAAFIAKPERRRRPG